MRSSFHNVVQYERFAVDDEETLMKRLCAILLAAVFMSAFNAIPAAENEGDADKLKAQVRESTGRGLNYLLQQQNEDGSFGEEEMNPAFTSLVVVSIAGSPLREKYMKTRQFEKALKFVLSCAQPDGGIYIADWAQNYHTSISLMAIAAVNDRGNAKQIEKTQKFLKDLQAREEIGVKPDDQSSGGFGYRKGFSGADMSNTVMTLMALKQSGLTAEDKVWQRAEKFIERCQNTKVDGGFIYRPNESKAGVDKKGNYRSYNSMTYAGLLSFIYANVDKDDKRVKAAVKWIADHWSLDGNYPIGKQGLYYNYHTMAKALNAYGEKFITDNKGMKHDWYRELSEELISMQNEDGSWVNKEDRWLEDQKVLVTCYCILALNEGYGDYK